MPMSHRQSRDPAPRRRARLLAALLGAAGVVCAGAFAAGVAPAQSLQERLNATEDKLSRVDKREGVLTTEISAASDRIAALQGQVAELRNKEATVAAELAKREAELDSAQARLAELRDRLRRAVEILEDRLVAIYKSGEPDLLTVVLQSNGFDELLERTEYLQRLEDQDSSIVGRVRELRDEMRATVETVKAARDQIAARKQELERTRAQLERRSAELASARSAQRSALGEVRNQKQKLEGDLSEISAADRGAACGAGRLDAPRRPDPGRLRRLHLAGKRPGHLGLRLPLGPHARGDRYRCPRGHADPCRQVG